MIRLLDQRANRTLVPLGAALQSLDRFGVLPELFEVFGREKLIMFLDIFAGQTFRVPDHDTLAHRIRDVLIWIAMEEDPSRVSDLAVEYSVSENRVCEIHREMRELMGRFQLRPLFEADDVQPEAE